MLKIPMMAIATAVALALAPAVPVAGQAQEKTVVMQVSATATRSGRLPINGVDSYYEVHGKGEPLLLLHGGLGSIDMFAPILPLLTASREVILVDLHGHGRTSLGSRSINMADIGRDMAALVPALGYRQVDVIGYSFGAWTALHMAAGSPQRVRRLVLMSLPYARDGFFPEMLPQQAALSAASMPFMTDTPMYKSYAAVAPRPEEFPRLLDEMGNLMRNPYDYSREVEKLSMPVMLIFGDSDMVRPEHIVTFYQKLGGGLKDAGWQREHMAKNRLAILPDVTHYESFMAPAAYRTALPFLDGKSGMESWAEAVARAR